MNNIKDIFIEYLPTDEEVVGSGKQLRAGKFLYPGFTHQYVYFGKQIAPGRYRYETGLEPDQVEQDRIEEVQKAKEELEKYYGKGTLDASNDSFWKERIIKMNKKHTSLDLSNPEDKLTYYAIKAGKIFEIAKSYDDAINSSTRKMWFLTEPGTFADLNAEKDRSINKAIAALEYIDENKGFDDLMILHKLIVSSDRGITRQTPKSTIYKDLSDFIAGKIVRTDKKRTAKQFLEATKLMEKDKGKAFMTAYVKDASYFNFIVNSEDGQLMNRETSSKYGNSIEKAVAYLSNPANQEELENIKTRVEKKWSE